MAKSDNSTSLIYATVKETLAAQQVQKNSLETKASTLIAFAGGIFALLMGSRETILRLAQISQTLILISISLFVLSVLLANVVTWIRRYRADPAPDILAKEYLKRPSEETELQLIANMIGMWKANGSLIERNANYLRAAFISQGIAFVLLGLALFLSIF
jgi:hypothetical protein